MANGDGKSQKMKIEKLEFQSSKLQDELKEEQDLNHKLKTQISDLKRNLKEARQKELQGTADKARL